MNFMLLFFKYHLPFGGHCENNAHAVKQLLVMLYSTFASTPIHTERHVFAEPLVTHNPSLGFMCLSRFYVSAEYPSQPICHNPHDTIYQNKN